MDDAEDKLGEVVVFFMLMLCGGFILNVRCSYTFFIICYPASYIWRLRCQFFSFFSEERAATLFAWHLWGGWAVNLWGGIKRHESRSDRWIHPLHFFRYNFFFLKELRKDAVDGAYGGGDAPIVGAMLVVLLMITRWCLKRQKVLVPNREIEVDLAQLVNVLLPVLAPGKLGTQQHQFLSLCQRRFW